MVGDEEEWTAADEWASWMFPRQFLHRELGLGPPLHERIQVFIDQIDPDRGPRSRDLRAQTPGDAGHGYLSSSTADYSGVDMSPEELWESYQKVPPKTHLAAGRGHPSSTKLVYLREEDSAGEVPDDPSYRQFGPDVSLRKMTDECDEIMTQYKVKVFVNGSPDWSSADRWDEPPDVTTRIVEVSEGE